MQTTTYTSGSISFACAEKSYFSASSPKVDWTSRRASTTSSTRLSALDPCVLVKFREHVWVHKDLGFPSHTSRYKALYSKKHVPQDYGPYDEDSQKGPLRQPGSGLFGFLLSLILCTAKTKSVLGLRQSWDRYLRRAHMTYVSAVQSGKHYDEIPYPRSRKSAALSQGTLTTSPS